MPKEGALSQLIREQYPFPISHACTTLVTRVDPNDRYQAILTCFAGNPPNEVVEKANKLLGDVSEKLKLR